MNRAAIGASLLAGLTCCSTTDKEGVKQLLNEYEPATRVITAVIADLRIDTGIRTEGLEISEVVAVPLG